MTTPMPRSRAALVTGCSTGIGRATALALHRAGLPVYASARRLESLSDLAAGGLTTLALDVTDEATAEGEDAYAGFRRALAVRYAQAYDGSRMRLASSPDAVAGVIVRAVRVRRARTRSTVGPVAKTMIGLRRFAPSPVFEAVIRSSFPVPEPGQVSHRSP
jgi:NAD(P)-dependent dehydrogenase (short-subunit alcohol dehydrogenase family)